MNHRKLPVVVMLASLLFLPVCLCAEANLSPSGSTSLKVLEALHGHLGPYVIIGGKMGDFAVGKLSIKKYTGVRVIVECEPKPPMSCMVDGLQATTGASYGKQNIFLLNAPVLKVRIINTQTHRGLSVKLTEAMEHQIKRWREEKVDVEKQGSLVSEMSHEQIFTFEEFEDK